MSNLRVGATTPSILMLPTELREQVVSQLDRVEDQFAAEQVLWQDSRDAHGAWVGNPAMWNAMFLRAIDRPARLRTTMLVQGATTQRANRHVLSSGLDWQCVIRLHTQMRLSRRALRICEVWAPKSPVTLQFKSILADSGLARTYGYHPRNAAGMELEVSLMPNCYVAPDYRLFQNPLVQSTFLTQQKQRCGREHASDDPSIARGFGVLHPYDKGVRRGFGPDRF